ncbi:hypothetical protein SELMODRAFT_425543 [Selaginella moellendorffii]|uniref:Uncharacterized protein n=1 Tax=Selaginella moellendorffii TaxID=88036 RepID=D8STF9_SELML|nr:hypothetical protein SELMODRAFT_425543 [Selaginella moellendorffii]
MAKKNLYILELEIYCIFKTPRRSWLNGRLLQFGSWTSKVTATDSRECLQERDCWTCHQGVVGEKGKRNVSSRRGKRDQQKALPTYHLSTLMKGAEDDYSGSVRQMSKQNTDAFASSGSKSRHTSNFLLGQMQKGDTIAEFLQAVQHQLASKFREI